MFVRQVAIALSAETMSKPTPAHYAVNLMLAGIAGMSGCVTLGMVIGALLTGLWIDNQAGSSPAFTILCIIVSIPVTLWVTLMVALRAARALQKRQYG